MIIRVRATGNEITIVHRGAVNEITPKEEGQEDQEREDYHCLPILAQPRLVQVGAESSDKTRAGFYGGVPCPNLTR